DLTKDTVEDATGCIPWLLETCVEDGKINLDATTLQGIWQQASWIVTEMHEQKIHWDTYCRSVDACIRRREVPNGALPFAIDHRYFYSEANVGNYACGVARDAVSNQLRFDGCNTFGVSAYLTSLDAYIHNQSVTGFFIEQAVLETVASRGLKDEGIPGPMSKINFQGFPTFETKRSLALYIPLSFNYRDIDSPIELYHKGSPYVPSPGDNSKIPCRF
ncbi:hypothetical protein Egran_06227, partial [Elaphomyces granulatus]